MLLIIDNYDSFTYNLYQTLAPFHADVRVVRNDKISVHEVLELKPDGIVLSPGPGRPEKAGICLDLIHTLLNKEMRSTIPLLGVCLGHQAITMAMGGRVIQSQDIVHGKDDHIFHCGTGLYQKLPLYFKAGRYHSLIAERETLPATLVIEAENKNNIIMGIRHQILPIYGMQFHPESILTPHGYLLLQAFAKECSPMRVEGTAYDA